MRAFVADRYGTPEQLRLDDLPAPEPQAGEVRIAVRATTVTRTDTATLAGHPWFARAMTGVLRPKDRVFGVDFAGTIDALGSGVTRFKRGDSVFGLSPDHFGAHAEYLCLPQDGAIAVIPEGIELQDAVVCEGAWYAWGSVGSMTSGQTALIYGASGAIGSAAVQLAKARGAMVTAVVGTPHVKLAQELGADIVIDYTVEDFTAIGETFDVVMDAVGKTSYFACKPLLKPDGVFRATDLGPYWSNIWLGLWSSITRSGHANVPFPVDAPGFVDHIRDLLADGRFRGVFDRVYAFSGIPEAYRYVASGQKTGIVSVDLDSDAAVRQVFTTPG